MLAVAKWIGDWDCFGKNSGYLLEEDVAVLYKIEATFGNGSQEKPSTKDIYITPTNYITFDSICHSDRTLYLQKILEITHLTDEDIVNISTFSTSENFPSAINLTLKDSEFWSSQQQFLCKQRDNLRNLYEKDLAFEIHNEN